jgi:hypothetical protein
MTVSLKKMEEVGKKYDEFLTALQDESWINKKCTDSKYLVMLEIVTEDLRRMASLDLRFNVGSTSFKSQITFLLNRLNSLNLAIKARNLTNEEAHSIFEQTTKNALVLKDLLDERIKSEKESMEELPTESTPQLEEVAPRGSIVSNTSEKPRLFHSLFELKESLQEASIDPIPSSRPSRIQYEPPVVKEGTAPSKKPEYFRNPSVRPKHLRGDMTTVDQEYLDYTREEQKKSDMLDQKIEKAMQDSLKKLQQGKNTIPKLGEQEYKFFRSTLFVPTFIPQPVLNRLSFSAELSEGGCLMHKQLILMVTSEYLMHNRLSTLLAEYSKRLGVRYYDVLQGSHIITKFSNTVKFVWLMNSANLGKIVKFGITTALFPWDTSMPNNSNSTELKALREQIEKEAEQKFSSKLEEVKKAKKEVDDIAYDTSDYDDVVEQMKNKIKDAKGATAKALKEQLEDYEERMDKLISRAKTLRSFIKVTLEKYEEYINSRKMEILKDLRKTKK